MLFYSMIDNIIIKKIEKLLQNITKVDKNNNLLQFFNYFLKIKIKKILIFLFLKNVLKKISFFF